MQDILLRGRSKVKAFFVRKRRLAMSLTALAAVLLVAGAAQALLQMRLTEGANTVTVTDSDGDGVVTYIGAVGAFNVNISSGLSKPLLGGPLSADMDLSSANVSNQAATLTIELTDTDFSLPNYPAVLTSAVGGTAQGTASFDVYANSDNAAFSTAGDLASASLGPFGPGAFSGTTSTLGTGTNGFSMTMVASVTHGAGVKSTSFDHSVQFQSVPEPSSLAMLLPGIAPLGLVLRRRLRRA